MTTQREETNNLKDEYQAGYRGRAHDVRDNYIAQLRSTLAEREEANAALKAEIVRLREATATKLIVEAHDFGQFSDDFNQPQARSVRKAIRELCEVLSTPFTPTALPELIEEVERRTIERCAEKLLSIGALGDGGFLAAIRALPADQIKLEELL